MRVRKKPVVVDAVQFVGQDRADIFRELGGAASGVTEDGKPNGVQWGSRLSPDGCIVEILIETLEGTMHAQLGDWIIRGVKGEFYPCRADIFAETYEDAEWIRNLS